MMPVMTRFFSVTGAGAGVPFRYQAADLHPARAAADASAIVELEDGKSLMLRGLVRSYQHTDSEGE